MLRIGAVLVLAAGLGGCCLPEKEALRPLGEDRVISFEDMLLRVRAQATAALEAFYIDNWTELEQAAQALEQSARFLPKTTNQPAPLEATVAKTAQQLGHEAADLAEAARKKSPDAATSALQKITLQVRLLRAK